MGDSEEKEHHLLEILFFIYTFLCIAAFQSPSHRAARLCECCFPDLLSAPVVGHQTDQYPCWVIILGTSTIECVR